MKLMPEEVIKLSKIEEDLTYISHNIDYIINGHCPQQMDTSQAISKIAEHLSTVIETILANTEISSDMNIDYQDIYGWGGQDYSPGQR